MKFNADPFAGTGVIALDQDELTTIQGGFGPLVTSFLIALAAGAIIATLSDIDDFVEGFQEGYNWARAD